MSKGAIYTVQEVEETLRKLGFTEEEILKIWFLEPTEHIISTIFWEKTFGPALGPDFVNEKKRVLASHTVQKTSNSA